MKEAVLSWIEGKARGLFKLNGNEHDIAQKILLFIYTIDYRCRYWNKLECSKYNGHLHKWIQMLACGALG